MVDDLTDSELEKALTPVWSSRPVVDDWCRRLALEVKRLRRARCETCAGDPRRTPGGCCCKECGIEGTMPWGG